MSNHRAQLRVTAGRGIFTTALGLALAVGVASPALAAGNGQFDRPQPLSKADRNTGGANGQCPGGPYCSTRNGSPSLNGNGKGAAVGKPCAGCVGKADNKNPHGQMPNGADHNAGYECDRNHGIGRSNPAHTGCASVPAPPKHDVPKHNPPKHDVPKHNPPKVTPAKHNPPKVTPAKHNPPKVTPAVHAPGQVSRPVVLGAVLVRQPAAALAGVTNPLPTSAAAGEGDTGGQLVAGGFTALAGFLALGAGFLLRRRHGDA